MPTCWSRPWGTIRQPLLDADSLEAGLPQSAESCAPHRCRGRVIVISTLCAACLFTGVLLSKVPEDTFVDGEGMWAPPAIEMGPLTVQLIQTAHGTGDRLSSLPDLRFQDDFHFNGPVVDVDASVTDQKLMGFGAAFTEDAALQFNGLRPELQQKVIEMYFGDSGLGYSAGRVPINSCDFSSEGYHLDEVSGNAKPTHLDRKLIDAQESMLSFISAAKNKTKENGRALHLLASPWSAPGWMQSHGRMNHSSSHSRLVQYRKSCAMDISYWIGVYKAHGIPIWGITVQSEPGSDSRVDSMTFVAKEEAQFIGHELGPTLRAAHPEVKIFGYDWTKNALKQSANFLYSNPLARKYLDGMAFDWNKGDRFDSAQAVHHQFPQALLLPSEAAFEAYLGKASWETGKWSFGERYANDIMGDLKAGATGWIDWNLLLSTDDWLHRADRRKQRDAAVVVSVREQKLHVHPQFYFIGHFSKYIPPGSIRIGTNTGNSVRYHQGRQRKYGTCTAEDGLDVVSFLRPDSRIATVVLNCGDKSADFKLREGGRSMFGHIPAHAIQTYVFETNDAQTLSIPK